MRQPLVIMLLALGLGAAAAAEEAAPLEVRLGTVAPRGSIWAQALDTMAEDWDRISGGRVRVRVYPGGVLGDGPAMIELVRSGRLQGVALSQIGLAEVEPAVDSLAIPLLLSNDAELDAVRSGLAPELEARLLDRGFVLLHWGDGGWIRFFSTRPYRTLDELRERTLFTAPGSRSDEPLWRALGLRSRPIELSAVAAALANGDIDVAPLPPVLALLDRSYRQARHLLDLRFTPIVAGTILAADTWEAIPPELRPALLAAARSAGAELREKVRRLDRESLVEMEARGLERITPDPETRARWEQEAVAAWSELRGSWVDAELFDEAVHLRDQARGPRS
ncbi:MAG: TRAP transporter substrate-binding protein DctP [Thermoanaerobaculia bacterium]|nr:TRAP transporter substrate-binding protein DctP [Thermoanaerobaculia bacterium]